MLLGTEIARVEKFTTSFRDGIDVRETLRHWNSQKTGNVQDIYIREIPPARGSLEVIVSFLRYPVTLKNIRGGRHGMRSMTKSRRSVSMPLPFWKI